MHLLASETLQLSCQAWELPFSFMGELYFTAALKKRPEQNTVPKMGRKVLQHFPILATCISCMYGDRKLSVQTDRWPSAYSPSVILLSFFMFGSIFCLSVLLQFKCTLVTYPEEIYMQLPIVYSDSLKCFPPTEVPCLMKINRSGCFYYHCHRKLGTKGCIIHISFFGSFHQQQGCVSI